MTDGMMAAIKATLNQYSTAAIAQTVREIGGAASVDPERACLRVWLLELYQEREGEKAADELMAAIGWE